MKSIEKYIKLRDEVGVNKYLDFAEVSKTSAKKTIVILVDETGIIKETITGKNKCKAERINDRFIFITYDNGLDVETISEIENYISGLNDNQFFNLIIRLDEKRKAK